MKAWPLRRLRTTLPTLALVLAVPVEGRSQTDETSLPAEGTYTLEVTPALGIPVSSGPAWAIFRDDRLTHIVMCRAADRIARGEIFFPNGDYLSGEWQLKSPLTEVTANFATLPDERSGKVPQAQLDVGGRFGSPATLTMRGRQGEFVEGKIAGEGTAATTLSGDRQPVTLKANFRARVTEDWTARNCLS